MVIDWEIKEEGGFKYIETGKGGTPLILLHGLMGALSNFEGILRTISAYYNVVVPMLPIFDMPIRKLSVSGLVDYVDNFIDYKGFDKVHVLGNSLGGHIAQLYALRRPEKVITLVLTGSSGLFESAMGSTFPKRGNYEYIKLKTESVFYNPVFATKDLVDEVFDTVNNRNKAIRVVAAAKSAVRHNLEKKLNEIKARTLLIWGKNDEVTPSWVGEKFHSLIPNSELHLLDECGHAPMMEKSDEFNRILLDFLHESELGNGKK
ncbi:MAG TPA: alpha/beta hydrolase [Saprospiraceae bacterium]|nr:alpha/beta hydrolase [Saprospiraceae bacterium]